MRCPYCGNLEDRVVDSRESREGDVIRRRHPLPFSSGFFLTSVTILGLMIPTPGGVGGFHKAVQVVLTNFYHFNVSASVAVALVVHIVGVLPVIVIGGMLVLREGITWRQLSSIADEKEGEGAE